MATASSTNTVEIYIKTIYAKKKIPATKMDASSDTQKSVETLEETHLVDLVMIMPTSTKKLTPLHQ